MIRFAGLLLAAFFMLAPIPARAAITTTAVPCVAAWTDLGAGPMVIQTTARCIVAVADATPGTSLVGFHISSTQTPFSYAGSSHLWVRSYDTTQGEAVISK